MERDSNESGRAIHPLSPSLSAPSPYVLRAKALLPASWPLQFGRDRAFGPDGALYVSNWGAAPAPIGQILRYKVY